MMFPQLCRCTRYVVMNFPINRIIHWNVFHPMKCVHYSIIKLWLFMPTLIFWFSGAWIDVTYNIGQNIVERFLKISEISFSVKYFRGCFLQYSSATVKIFISGASWALGFNYKHISDFLEISLSHMDFLGIFF